MDFAETLDLETAAVNCEPASLLRDIHYRLPLLSHGRFGSDLTNASLTDILPGEIVHIAAWACIVMVLSYVLLACFYALCCYICVRCKRGQCSASSDIARQLLRYTTTALTVLSVLGVLLAFWPESVMHNGITSSSDDVKTLLPEIGRHVIDRVLLVTEQRRHIVLLIYLVALLLFLTVDIAIIFLARTCQSGAGILVMTVGLAAVTSVVHTPLLVFLFAVLVMYADVCVSIYSLDDGKFCSEAIGNASQDINPNSLNVFCNQTVYYGLILILVLASLAALLVVSQLFGFSYGAWLCCYKGNYYFDDIEMEKGSNISLDELNDASSSSSIPWDSQHHFIELKPVQQNLQEWKDVDSQFKATLSEARITSLERIQNRWLWDSYMVSKSRLYRKNKSRSKINEKRLFHGTSQTAPEKIYKSEKGFDFRYGNRGLWGKGAYFAVNASYSDKYAYKHGGKKQILLALVLTGESTTCPQNNSMTTPPTKPNSMQDENMFVDENYDSVRGHTGGSEIYVVYDHDKAYPAYLITYV